MRKKKQISLWLDLDSCDSLEELAKGSHKNAVIEELIQQEVTRRKGEIVELKTLPIVRQIIQEELLKALSQLRSDQREDQQRNTQMLKTDLLREMKDREHRSDDRLAALTVRAIREGGISRRMLFTVLSKEDPELAMAAYEDAKAKVGKELTTRISSEDF